MDNRDFDDMEFAIVGAAVRLPGVADLDEFRTDLLAGGTHFDTVTREESVASGLPASEIDSETYIPLASILADAEHFDRDFFGMTAAEARATDPQHRLLLSLAHDAMESAGLNGSSAVCGAYTSVSASSYYLDRVVPELESNTARVDMPSFLGNDRDFVSTRLAYKLGFTGPAITVQTACSSSLVALHQACLGLAFGDVDIALVGAVSLKIPQAQGYVFEHGGILSPTGESRPFDAKANGTIRGSGGGAVVVRRLDDAIANGDNVLAVVAGTAINNDGANRMSFSAPSASGQQRALTKALARAQIAPDRVGYIEAHGTGTPLGDPIEFKAISRAYKSTMDRAEPRYLGSLKANFGHLDVAAGVVGLIKALLVVRHGQVFPQPSYDQPNDAIDLTKARFDIATAPVSPADSEYAAVSSFGMGGTNAHAVLRRAVVLESQVSSAPAVVTLTARTDKTLADYRSRLARFLRDQPDVALADVAATVAKRTVHAHSWSARVESVAELVERLAGPSDDAAVESDSPVGHQIWLPPVPLDVTYCSVPPTAQSSEPRESNVATSPRDVRSHFLALVAEELGTDVDDDTDFFDAGGESIALVGIVGKLSDLAGFRPDFDGLDGKTRVGDMIGVLSAQADSQVVATARLLRFGADGGRRIYFYPPAGGTNFGYAALSRLVPEFDMRAFKATALVDATIEQIAAECISILESEESLDRPLLLGGYSFGGNVAFEIARQLEAAGHPAPENIVMFDSFAPSAFRNLGAGSQQMATEVEQLARNASADDLERFTTTWLANNRALGRHRPDGVISAPITLLRAQEQLSAKESETLGIDVDVASNWQQYTEASVRIVNIPGGHYTIFTDRSNLAALARSFVDVLGERR
ncbi:beta-ketoacyl synthase N-terminal-like domain-containing protein [Antrihabitans cavernicola]|uniref:Uncharacterized protein n=1 Tax=Antrihabitans cavernicola TaxID=2495913 RepID=A0A5A7SJM9_9NOCA|nr:beta-ketoacyl synthase N-terminal-like domain-containing protein [Spelaeibacter cavernicola]KAA0024853.1 hypothetical protein FOY51_02690 [Spelaeibacter cavernicola]